MGGTALCEVRLLLDIVVWCCYYSRGGRRRGRGGGRGRWICSADRGTLVEDFGGVAVVVVLAVVFLGMAVWW